MREEKQKLVLLIGFIGAGKTTFAMELLKRAPEQTIRISMDDIVQMLSFYNYQKSLVDFYLEEELELLMRALANGFDVIIDRTNLDRFTRAKFIEIGQKFRKFAKEIQNRLGEPDIFEIESKGKAEKLLKLVEEIPEESYRESFKKAIVHYLNPALSEKPIKDYCTVLNRLSKLEIIGVYFDVSLEICLKRRLEDPFRAQREKIRAINWHEVLKKMKTRFEFPELSEGFDRIEIRDKDFNLLKVIY